VSNFLQFTFSGITLGSILALLSIGWVVVYRVSGVLNLAQGALFVIGALTFISLSDSRGWPFAFAALTAIAFSSAAGIGLDGILRVARPGNHAAPLIITLGFAELAAEVSRQIWGPNIRLLGPFLRTEPFKIFGAALAPHTILLWVGTGVLLVLSWWVFEKSPMGKALQACSESPEGASLVGINPLAMRTLAFGIAGAVGAAAGILLAPVTAIGWDSGLSFGIKGFTAALLGGWTYPGAVASGLLIGLAENYAAGYISSTWKDPFTYSVLLIALLLRPQGLLTLNPRFSLTKVSAIETSSSIRGQAEDNVSPILDVRAATEHETPQARTRSQETPNPGGNP